MTQRFIHAPCSSSTASSGDALTAACAPFVEGSLRTALELVAKSHRVFTGVGPHEAMIGGFPGNEAARRAFRTVAVGLGRMVTRLPKPNDGVVCLDETKFPALRDHIALPVGHTLMLVSPRIARQTAAFLRAGEFRR